MVDASGNSLNEYFGINCLVDLSSIKINNWAKSISNDILLNSSKQKKKKQH
jgi:hypothetical protein